MTYPQIEKSRSGGMVDAFDSKSNIAICGGSSPPFGTKNNSK